MFLQRWLNMSHTYPSRINTNIIKNRKYLTIYKKSFPLLCITTLDYSSVIYHRLSSIVKIDTPFLSYKIRTTYQCPNIKTKLARSMLLFRTLFNETLYNLLSCSNMIGRLVVVAALVVGLTAETMARLPPDLCSVRDEAQDLFTEAYREASGGTFSGFETKVLETEPVGGYPLLVGTLGYARVDPG